MTNKINNGGAAFPRPMSVSHGGFADHQYNAAEQEGMTYRQWLAGLALQGLLACSTVNGSPEALAEAAVMDADALIAELEKEEV